MLPSNLHHGDQLSTFSVRKSGLMTTPPRQGISVITSQTPLKRGPSPALSFELPAKFPRLANHMEPTHLRQLHFVPPGSRQHGPSDDVANSEQLPSAYLTFQSPQLTPVPPSPTPSVPQPDMKLAPQATITPTSCVGTSAIRERDLQIIEWCLFDGLSQNEVVKLFSSKYPDQAITSRHGISAILRKYGKVWYAEQNARRPWSLLSQAEQHACRAKGLSVKDFPFVHPRDLQKGGEAQSQALASKEQISGATQRHQQPLKGSEISSTNGTKPPVSTFGPPMKTTPKKIRTSIATKSPRYPPMAVLNGIMSKCEVNESNEHSAQARKSGEEEAALHSDGSHYVPGLNCVIPLDDYNRNSTVAVELTDEIKAELEKLRIAITATEKNWERACQSGDSGLADLIEEQLDRLEDQAKTLNREHYLAWRKSTWSMAWV